MLKIIHQRKKCIGCGACVAVCPKFFEMSKDGRALLKKAKQKGNDFELQVEKLDCLEEASNVCPAGIIKIQK